MSERRLAFSIPATVNNCQGQNRLDTAKSVDRDFGFGFFFSVSQVSLCTLYER